MSEAGQTDGADRARCRQGLALVTGGSGHLGANLVRRLLAEGQAVRVLYREGSNNSALEGLDVERVRGDLRDPDAMRAAARGCRHIYHCAARISTVVGGEREIYDCNVLGTRNVLRAAVAAGVERVVVTGSFSAVGHLPDRPSDEDVPFYPFERHLPYGHTKALVEHECWHAAAADGLDVVVVTSCAIVGPNDFKPSRMGRLLCDFAAGKLRAYVPGGFDFVSTHDIVQGHLLAMDRGRRGHRYIISTQFHTMDEIVQMFSEITGRKHLPLRLPGPLMSALAEVTSFVGARLFPGREQLITPAAVRLLRLGRRADTSKARRELGFRPTQIRPALEQAYEFFVRRGKIVPPARQGPVPPETAPTRQRQPGAAP